MPKRSRDRKSSKDDRADEPSKEEIAEASAARDFAMARLAACRSALTAAVNATDEAIAHFCDPSDDHEGEEREELLEFIDEEIGNAATAVQLAQGALEDTNPEEGEADPDDRDDDDPKK